jgi:hypothetical protein
MQCPVYPSRCWSVDNRLDTYFLELSFGYHEKRSAASLGEGFDF